MILQILRGAFVLLVASVAALYVLSFQQTAESSDFQVLAAMIVGALVLAGAVIAADVLNKQKKLSAVSGVFLGLGAGLLAAYALSFVVDLFGTIYSPEVTATRPSIELGSSAYYALDAAAREMVERDWRRFAEQHASQDAFFNLLEGVKVIIGLITCYLGISLVLQTKDDFRFVIPYVEFAKEIRGNRPTLLDTSVIVDGRILDIVETRVMQGAVIVPRFVLNELQTIADSSDKLKRARGRRGLDVLKKLQDSPLIDVHIDDRDAEGGNVDQKLVSLGQDMQARVMTNDYNLNKVATLRGVDVINMNDLAKAMRPVVLPGEHMTVKIVKPGESPTQGVGYLDDGTMVVVEGGRKHMHETIDLSVTSTLQTSAGRMIFGKFEGPSEAGANGGDRSSRHDQTPPPAADSGPDKAPAGATDADKPHPRPASSAPGRRNPRRG